MNTLTKLLLYSAFVFLPVAGVVPLYAQTSSQCVELQNEFDVEIGTPTPQEAISDLQIKVKKLEACLKEVQFSMSIHDPNLMESQVDDNRKKLLTVESKLYDTEERLNKAEETIEVLNLRLLTLEAHASKSKVPTSKSVPGFMPDTRATTPHPASKKPAASANNPMPAVKDGTH